MKICRICLEPVSIDKMNTLSCGCEACIECETNWALTQTQDLKTYIKCPFNECGLMLYDIQSFLPSEILEKLTENQLNSYINHNSSIKKCPQSCGFAGFVKKPFQPDYFCEKCLIC